MKRQALRHLLALLLVAAGCASTDRAPDTSDESGETGTGTGTGTEGGDASLMCDVPGEWVLAIPQGNGLCADCKCGAYGVLTECMPLYECPSA